MEEFKGQSLLGFIRELPNDEACKAYLAKIKWRDGFICMKCKGTKGCKKSGYKYQCHSCQHVESSTANTLFHKVKFGLQKAFCVVFEMSTSSKSASSIQMGKRFEIRQGTAWHFMQKAGKAMKSSQKHPLTELVHVDEFTVGGKEQGKQGRSCDSKKKKAVIAVESSKKRQVERVYVKAVNDCSAKSLTPIFEEHISTTANMATDKWRGHQPLKKNCSIEQILSNNGKNFKGLHVIVMQLKSWLRAIPTHVSKWHAQAYFDEFCSRINRSRFKQNIFHKTIQRMVEAKPIYHNQIKQILSV